MESAPEHYFEHTRSDVLDVSTTGSHALGRERLQKLRIDRCPGMNNMLFRRYIFVARVPIRL